MQNGEIISALIARIRQNNTDNVIIRSKLYNLLNNVTSRGTMECPKVSIVILLKQNHFFKPKQDE